MSNEEDLSVLAPCERSSPGVGGGKPSWETWNSKLEEQEGPDAADDDEAEVEDVA